MTTRTEPWPTGVPCWTDLTVPDVEAAKRFYGAVLGWTFADTDAEYGGYTIAQVNGAAAAGIGPLPEPGLPSAWTLYFATPDAEATAAAVVVFGGELLVQPGDVGPMGRMAIAADPAGATFGLWQGKEMIGAGVTNEPGGLTWEDLRAKDPGAAQQFYAAVFGYELHALEAAGPDYVTFHQPGEDAPLGGMGGMFGADDQPSHWLVYFGVADAQAASQAVTDNGGTVVAPPFDTPYGTMAGYLDTAGALFWTVKTAD